MNSGKKIYQQIADTLERDLPSYPGTRMPSVRDLSLKYKVSPVTMLKAMRILREKKLVWYGPGKAVVILGRNDPASLNESGEITGTRTYIEEQIMSGRFRAGQPLPKQQYFISTCQVSRNTVCKALALLEVKGLVHRRSKKWFTGPRSANEITGQQSLTVTYAQKPVILLIIPTYEYYHFCSNHYSIRFLFHSLLAELNAFGIETIIALKEPSVVSTMFPTGLDQIQATIKKLGNRYMGCFLAGNSQNFPEAESWMRLLRAHGKPAGVFSEDIDDTEGTPPRVGDGCFRAYMSVGWSANAAVEVLHNRGHRRIAFVNAQWTQPYDWLHRRRDTILRKAQSYNDGTSAEMITIPDPPVRRIMPAEWYWSNSGHLMLEHIEDIKASLSEKSIDADDMPPIIRQNLILKMPMLEAVFTGKKPTAIIAANDENATDILLWLRYTGRQVPRDISLISFDNNPNLTIFQFSTFDRGQLDLGYLIAHRLINDIAVKKDANGNITALPRLFDRGSISAL